MNGFSALNAHENQTIPYGRRFHLGIFALSLMATVFAMLLAANTTWAATLHSGEGGTNPGVTISAPNPPQGPAGTNVIVSVSNIAAGTQVSISIGSTDGTCTNSTPINGAVGTANSTGSVQISLTWPALPTGKYPVCAFGSGLPSQGLASDNQFTETSQVSPTLSIPTAATSGSSVNFTGQNWTPGTTVGVYISSAGGTGCDALLATATVDNTDLLSGSFTIPSVNTSSSFLVTAVNPPGTCSGSVAPTLKVTAPMTIDPVAASVTATATATGGSKTATPSATSTATPAASNGTATPGTRKGTATPTTGKATATPTSPVGTCPPFPGVLCSSVGGFPGWLLCLILLLLLSLLLLLVLWLVRRRDEEVVVIEEEITNQVDANTIQPMGNLTFVRVARVTTRIVHRPTGAIRREQVRVYEEFADGAGNIRRRRRTA